MKDFTNLRVVFVWDFYKQLNLGDKAIWGIVYFFMTEFTLIIVTVFNGRA